LPRGVIWGYRSREPSRTVVQQRSESWYGPARLDVEVTGTETDWTARVIETGTAAKEFPEVSVAKVSGGATFVFEPRKSLPLTVV